MAPRLPVQLTTAIRKARTSATRPPTDTFRLIKPGRGGLLYFHDYQNSLPACQTQPANPSHHTLIDKIGIHVLTKSQGTGVFFALSEQSCFAAHITAFAKTNGVGQECKESDAEEEKAVRYHVSEAEGEQLQRLVMTALHKSLTGMGHTVENVGVTQPYYKRSLLLVQPALPSHCLSSHAGSYVAKAVWEYLKLQPEQYPVKAGYDGCTMKFAEEAHLVRDGNAGLGGLIGREEVAEEGDEIDHIGDWTFELDSDGEQ